MLKFSKKNIIIILIVAFLISVMSNLYDYVNEALDYKNTKETKARENLNSLILWSKNEAKEELEYAKKLSKETYNQEKVTKEIIKNLEKIKTSIEDIRILTFYGFADEDEELTIKAGQIILKTNTDIITYLLYNERNIINHQTYFLFDKERFKVFEDFLFFLNTHLEEDFLQKDINNFNFKKIVIYINVLIGYNRAFTDMYLGEFSQDCICDLNNPKTIAILNGIEKINIAVDNSLKVFNKELELFINEDDRTKLKRIINYFQTFKLGQKQTNELKSIQAKLKECEK
ncbi:hypothetical protein B6S12_10240 [Helicobacter valdiviensis]|uniref:Uncharacterized protein n=1 Tax=Helicobacter valdiviensis TaxID=1458358 RepID=A0A2W6MTI1_9HELI|nr:hypothetical protein [Helicobacter valdiviensis]PZT47219.1 hypothetical protein B6S12_10240 [Helicobacter valdiviensis]